MKGPTNKADFMRRYEAGEFGNMSPSWPTVEEALANWDGLFGIRVARPGGKLEFFVPPAKLKEVVDSMPKPVNISIMIPAGYTLNAEVVWNPDIMLRYSEVDAPMRDALRECERNVEGLAAIMLLKRKMWPQDYEELMNLHAIYPDSAIEFSCFIRATGTVPNRNTIFWEVRDGY